MNEIYVIQSETGDEYKIPFTSERSGIIADEILDRINSEGIEVVEIGLGRSKGTAPTGSRVLAQIEQIIADIFLSHPNVVISFFCDFINFIPSMNKKKSNMTVQEYRSQLFSCMFERYTAQHQLPTIHNRVVTIQGVSEPYFFHIIARQEHLAFVDMIAEGHHKDFDK